MLDPRLNSSLTNTMSTIAVAQLLADNLPTLFKINRTGSAELLNISSALGLTINLLNIAGVSYDELLNILTNMIQSVGEDSLLFMDKTIRLAILGVLDGLVSCSNNPIIGDNFLDTRIISGKEVTGEGFKINIDILDIFNLFSKSNPTDPAGSHFYGDVTNDCSPSEVWKSGDLNTFLWYIINMVDADKMQKSNRKTIWDTRNSDFKDKVIESTSQSYNDIVIEGDDVSALGKTFSKLFRIKFDDATNNFTILLDPERYRKRKNDVVKFSTIYDFNKDFLDNIRLLYPKPIISGILDIIANGSISLVANVNGSISLSDSILETTVNEVITKIIEGNETEIEDCYFSFSNEEYNNLIRDAELRRKGIITSTGDTISGRVLSDDEIDSIMANISGLTSESTFQEQKTIIKESIEQLTGGEIINNFTDNENIKAVLETNYSNWSADDYKNKAMSLITAFVKKIVESVITPKIVLIYLIDYSFANGKFPETKLDFLSTFNKLLGTIIMKVMDFLIEKLFGVAYEKIKSLILNYVTQILLERIQKYKDIILALVGNCTLSLNLPSSTTLIGNIDNVTHADILETKNTPGETDC